ncbi:flagellar basal body rod protein FlgB [Bacillus sp. AGMB 02131]|uniref:Flagellar basal body rod protein FlgB n=1 Tax=Peribacillus faecalis TaxID=2772559 RepID=A0A927D0S6_9BACI|nr:flagellar basal body rod protein FlgB [Peribacillus faecalis]MBD3109450.1 flagellar basal body rod protein FlgB [Peribacillus faecalis]
MSLFSGTITSLEYALDYASQKQKVISNNIANADTPNYKAKSVSFSKMLESEMNSSLSANKTDNRHFDFTSTTGTNGVYVNKNVSYNHNGNSVDIDQEMSSLAMNQIYYNAVTDRINGKFQSLQNVIKGGR